MFWERKSFGQYKLLFENTIFERVCSKFMIKLSRSKVFLLANILSRSGPCSNYSLLLVTNSTWSWLLKGKTWSLADRTSAKSKQTPLWSVQRLPGSDQIAVTAVFAKFKSIFHPHQSWDPGNWHLIYISAPLQLSWLQHKEAECYKIYRHNLMLSFIWRTYFCSYPWLNFIQSYYW